MKCVGPVTPASVTENGVRGAGVSGGEPRAMLPAVSAALPQVAGGYPGPALPLYGVQSKATGRQGHTQASRSHCSACVGMMACRSGRALNLAPCDHQLIQSPS